MSTVHLHVCAVNGCPENAEILYVGADLWWARYTLVRLGLVGSHVIRILLVFMAVKYEPAARWGHVAAAVEDKVYVWGGFSECSFVSHDGPDRTDIILEVDILDVKV